MKYSAPLLLAAVLLALAPAVLADVLLIDAIAEAPPNSASGLLRPRPGQNMDKVRSQFGEPEKVYPWVGEPPITRWDYPDYSVFFEHELVINTVVRR